MEPSSEGPTMESVRLAQNGVGEALWLTARARPDLSRMDTSVTKAPEAVLKAAAQVKGYLLSTEEEGIKFQVEAHEDPILTAYTDASFTPGSQESHGSFVVMLGSAPVFWRSGRQSFVTLCQPQSQS